VTLEEISNAEVFVENLDKIELPSQLVAVLADPLLQKFMLLRPSAEGVGRVCNWVWACVSDVANGDADAGLLLDVVKVMHDYALATKVSNHEEQFVTRVLTNGEIRLYPPFFSIFLRGSSNLGTVSTSETWSSRRLRSLL
jgi:hypothetical protein